MMVLERAGPAVSIVPASAGDAPALTELAIRESGLAPPQLPPLVAKWEPRVGEAVSEVRIKRMKTLWGSCNAAARRIWLNLELAKKPPGCAEFILVHEMVHLLERHHNERFRELMDAIMPAWRHHRDELNRMPLAHEDWSY